MQVGFKLSTYCYACGESTKGQGVDLILKHFARDPYDFLTSELSHLNHIDAESKHDSWVDSSKSTGRSWGILKHNVAYRFVISSSYYFIPVAMPSIMSTIGKPPRHIHHTEKKDRRPKYEHDEYRE